MGRTAVSPKIGTLDPYLFIVNLLSLQGAWQAARSDRTALWTRCRSSCSSISCIPLTIALRRRIGTVLASVGVSAAMKIVRRFVFERHEIILIFASYWFSWTLGASCQKRNLPPDAVKSPGIVDAAGDHFDRVAWMRGVPGRAVSNV